MANIRRLFDEELKVRIVEEIESGQLSRVEAARELGTSKASIKQWLEEYGRFRPRHDILEVVMKSEKERIAELEKALADAHLKNRVYEEIIDLAGKKYKTNLKKTFGTAQSESSKGGGSKSKRSAQRSE